MAETVEQLEQRLLGIVGRRPIELAPSALGRDRGGAEREIDPARLAGLNAQGPRGGHQAFQRAARKSECARAQQASQRGRIEHGGCGQVERALYSAQRGQANRFRDVERMNALKPERPRNERQGSWPKRPPGKKGPQKQALNTGCGFALEDQHRAQANHSKRRVDHLEPVEAAFDCRLLLGIARTGDALARPGFVDRSPGSGRISADRGGVNQRLGSRARRRLEHSGAALDVVLPECLSVVRGQEVPRQVNDHVGVLEQRFERIPADVQLHEVGSRQTPLRRAPCDSDQLAYAGLLGQALKAAGAEVTRCSGDYDSQFAGPPPSPSAGCKLQAGAGRASVGDPRRRWPH